MVEEVPADIEGEVQFESPGLVQGWAWAPADPDRRLRIEVLAGEQLIAAFTADRPGPGAPDGGPHGFRVDLSKLLRYGPHAVTVRVAGSAQALPGGRFHTGVFAADGEVDCPGYLDSPEDRGRLEQLPFEHQARIAERIEQGRLVPRLVNRLRRERLAFGDARGPRVLLVRLPGAGEVAWPRFCAAAARTGAGGWLIRRPHPDRVTVAHGAISDTTLAIRGAVLAAAPEPVLTALSEGRVHPLWLWLSGRALSWRVHPEALTSRVGDWSPLSPAELDQDESLCRELLAGEPVTLARAVEDLPMPAVLVPVRRARKTSVLVPFRGRPELTLRCIHALAGQRLTGELELVLVDNQSDPAEAQRIVEGARRMLGSERVLSLGYDAPFSHSAENNLAAGAATGDVLVICNNDVVLQDPALLQQLGAWALWPGVGSVGCRLEDPGRERGSYGHIFQPPTDNPFAPALRENPDPAFGCYVHAVPGNTLALAAIARDLYLELGGLDEVRFPIGYNDVDFMLRASRRGLIHLYLGHVWAEHRRGSSRTGDDEDLQALMINQAYPETAQGHLTQLSRTRLRPSADQASGSVPPTPEDAALIERLEDLMARHEAVERQRIDLVRTRTDDDPRGG